MVRNEYIFSLKKMKIETILLFFDTERSITLLSLKKSSFMLFRCMIFIYSSIVEPADEEEQPRSEHKQEPKGLGAPPAAAPLAPTPAY